MGWDEFSAAQKIWCGVLYPRHFRSTDVGPAQSPRWGLFERAVFGKELAQKGVAQIEVDGGVDPSAVEASERASNHAHGQR